MAREQRKLAAILATDVVGYSRLMGRDESGTLAHLREHRQDYYFTMRRLGDMEKPLNALRLAGMPE